MKNLFIMLLKCDPIARRWEKYNLGVLHNSTVERRRREAGRETVELPTLL
jgi:hypothetical protein